MGGWDGRRDMGDLWYYHISEQRWTLIQRDTAAYVVDYDCIMSMV